jgi:hypothetical protein
MYIYFIYVPITIAGNKRSYVCATLTNGLEDARGLAPADERRSIMSC